jgi:hypothetical protein
MNYTYSGAEYGAEYGAEGVVWDKEFTRQTVVIGSAHHTLLIVEGIKTSPSSM